MGFNVLQQAVEALWNGSLQEFVQETVTGPLEMNSTSFLPPNRDSVTLASGHDRQGKRLPPTAWSSPSAALQMSWGLGWAVAQDESDTIFLHWGSNPGYKSLAMGSLQQALGLVVLTNGDNGLEIATSLVPIIFGHDYPFLDFYMLHPDD